MKKNGFTLLEIMAVLLITSLIFGTLVTVFLAITRHVMFSFSEHHAEQRLVSGFRLLEEDVRHTEQILNVSKHSLSVRYENTTVNYLLRTSPHGYDLWRETSLNGTSQSLPLVFRVLSPNTVFSMQDRAIAVTLCAMAQTSNVLHYNVPYVITLSAIIFPRNTAYGPF